MADWANLPEGLSDLIAQHVHQIKDMVVIDSLCKSWRSTLSFESPHFPLLMLAEQPASVAIEEDEDAITKKPRFFFDLFTSKIYEVDLPETCTKKCLGTGFGWMLTIGFDLKINLLHPFTRNQISLPHQSMFPRPFLYDLPGPGPSTSDELNLCVKKAVLSSSPKQHQQETCVIMVIYGEISLIAFARVGSKEWIDVPTPSRSYDDLIYYKEQFYAVDCHGSVVVCDINYDGNSKATVIAPFPVGLMDHDKKYLVESSGDLLLISRIYGGPDNIFGDNDNKNIFEAHENNNIFEAEEDNNNAEENNNNNNEEFYDLRDLYHTIGFLIFKMERADLEAKDGNHEYPYRWVKVNNLGNRALFLGNNSSTSLPASSNLKANCVYFTEDNDWIALGRRGGGHDMGVFNMEHTTIKPHYPSIIHSKFSPSLWYI